MTKNEEIDRLGEVGEIFSRVLNKAGLKKAREIQDELYAFMMKLVPKYPDFKRYRMWHVAAITIGEPGVATEFDFPGNDSLEKQIRELGEKYLTIN